MSTSVPPHRARMPLPHKIDWRSLPESGVSQRKHNGGLALYVDGADTFLRVIPDAVYAGMWCVKAPDGCLSDTVNPTRAKDAACGRYLNLSGGGDDAHGRRTGGEVANPSGRSGRGLRKTPPRCLLRAWRQSCQTEGRAVKKKQPRL
jgi:hypothetical protein